MKFYTDLNKFDLKLFFSHHFFYETHHNWFYLCLLPKEIKLNFLNKVTSRTKNAFQSILNVTEEFCSSIEECDYVLLPPTSIHEYSVQKYKSEIKNAIKNNKKTIIFYGNDDDGSHNIPHQTYNPSPGYGLFFPSNWSFPHSGQKVLSGKKRVAVTWFYVIEQTP